MLGTRRRGFGGSAPGPVKGTSTNDAAVAGDVGELISSIVALGSATSISTATPVDVTTISLTPGDWDVSGTVGLIPAAGTSVTVQAAGISLVSATLPVAADGGLVQEASAAEIPAGVATILTVGPTRISVSATTTVYLVASATFTVSTMTRYGGLRARRMR